MSGASLEATLAVFEDYLRTYIDRREKMVAHAPEFFNSIKYSLFSGGKRFRPQICFATAQMLNVSYDRVIPLAAAVECIHTYSLIHDDLPCMDDDDFRRDQPTNHRLYGEAQALLAGDGLLTEAFAIVSEGYIETPEIGLALVKLMSEAAGSVGMVAGQVLDIDMQRPGSKKPDAQNLLYMLSLKTGALIRLCVEGVTTIARKDAKERQHLREFGAHLGLAFQLADDLLDYKPEAAEPSGLPAVIGAKETEKKLNLVSEEAMALLKPYEARAEVLRALVAKNLRRNK
jgi:geranylgeranyl diphosphate synthase, type II